MNATASIQQTGRAAPAGRPSPPHGRRHLALVPDEVPNVPLPPIGLNGPDGQQGTLPGVCWPTLAVRQFQRPGRPLIGWWEIDKKEGVNFLIDWQHKLHRRGEPYERPFGSMFFLME